MRQGQAAHKASKTRRRRCEVSIDRSPTGLHLRIGRGELNSIPARNRALSPANLVSEIPDCGRDSEAPLRRKEENHSSVPHKTLLLLISFSISQLDLAMTESNISLRRLVMVLMYKESTSRKMDQCYFPSCYHVHYCFNYQRSDNGYPRPISSSRTLSASRASVCSSQLQRRLLSSCTQWFRGSNGLQSLTVNLHPKLHFHLFNHPPLC